MPSDTGEPGGKRTGYRVSHYVIEGGPFDCFCCELQIGGVDLSWRTAKPRARVTGPGSGVSAVAGNKNKTGFLCAGCGERAWARAAAQLDCGRCKRPMGHRR